MSDIPESLLRFAECPAKALSVSSRVWLSKRLNPELDSLSRASSLLQDWRGVAEFLEFTSIDIDNFARDKNPTVEVLRQWTFQDTSMIGKLLSSLRAVERFDILRDEQLDTNLEKDFTAYQKFIEAQSKEISGADNQPIQVDEITSVDEFKNITIGEATTGVPEYFDAFVCYTYQDFDFVRQMMHKLETVHGLKLCIVSRDLIPGCAEYVIMAKLIQERCRKMIIVLSPDYIESKECEFQTRFAHSLAPGAKERKLIPVIYRRCAVPSILNHICTVDYTRCDVVEWFWVRLANSLKNANRNDGLIPDTRSFAATTTYEHGRTTSNASGTRDSRLTTSSSMGPSMPGSWHASPLCSEISAVGSKETTVVSRTSSDNSLTETGSNTSWTDLSSPNLFPFEDQLMASVEAAQNLSAPLEFDVEPAGSSNQKKKGFMKILNAFKKH